MIFGIRDYLHTNYLKLVGENLIKVYSKVATCG